MPMFDSSPAFTPGLCFWLPGPIRLQGTPPDADEVSRFSRVQFLDVRMALGLRRACRKLTLSLPPVWPSRWEHSVGARNSFFEARFLARRCLGLRFARHLAAPGARLEVKMVRYSFLVGLFHPQLHAGLSRRFLFPTCTPVYPDDCAPSRSRLVKPSGSRPGFFTERARGFQARLRRARYFPASTNPAPASTRPIEAG